MADSVESAAIKTCQSQYLALQLDEFTDSQRSKPFGMCQSVPTNTTGEDIFKILNNYIVSNKVDWTPCVGVSTDGAASMTGKIKGLTARIQTVAPLAAATHCCIHREQLATTKMPFDLKRLMEE
ncbi:hypothetical protein C0Q70_06567 [Pomacea canaliculata]|uniref:DUF4371 domain-containing protein n=1 Tax=Pomacea canaliculata TaxID=400727 RepID=A0A2T7PPF2_POMCA|nr:hypothetical protein C0Q70_06567 [Pomacea canaliculata]